MQTVFLFFVRLVGRTGPQDRSRSLVADLRFFACTNFDKLVAGDMF